MSKFHLAVYPKEYYNVRFEGIPYLEQPKRLKSLLQWAKDEKADIVYNLAHFNMGHGEDQYGPIYGRTITYVRSGRVGDIGYSGTAQRITLPNGSVCAGFKAGIVGGNEQSGLSTTRDSRNANGWTKDGHYFHVQAENCSEVELVKYCLPFAELLLIQDGGGSVGVVEDGKHVYEPSGRRAVPSVVCINRKRKAEDIPPYIVENAFTFRGPSPSTGEQKKINAIVLHHAAGDTTAQQVHNGHYNRGWWGIGYHYYVEKSGVVFRGRPERFVGSHAGSRNDYNEHSIGICFEGDFYTKDADGKVDTPTPEQIYSGDWLVNDILSRYDIEEVKGHKELTATGCPGDNFPLQRYKDLLKPEVVGPPATTRTIYRVQVGAFGVKQNAENYLKQLQRVGFDGFITEVELDI